MENGYNCLSVDKIISLSNKTGISTDYILLGKPNYINSETAKLLSAYKEEDVESIFETIKHVMRILNK